MSSSAVVKIIKVLGEGGFSFVYLAQDEHSGVRLVYQYSALQLSDLRFGTCSDNLL